LGWDKYTGDVAAGRAFIPDKPRLVLERGNPDHFIHRGLATRTSNGASLLRQVGHERIPSNATGDNAVQSSLVAVATDLYSSKLSVKKYSPRLSACPMSLRTYLDDQSFDAETVRLMGVAFEIALATLRPPDSDPLREAVAWKIIELAKAGERDPERLCDGALKDLPPAVSVPPLALPPAGSQLPHGEKGLRPNYTVSVC
jgi:hypothetical protein